MTSSDLRRSIQIIMEAQDDGMEARIDRRFGELIRALLASPLADRIVVFGSVPTGKERPGDIDIFVELASRDELSEANHLLSLARKYYGMLDPFLLVPNPDTGKKSLWVRDDQAIFWTGAKNAKAIYESAKAGTPLKQVRWPAQWQIILEAQDETGLTFKKVRGDLFHAMRGETVVGVFSFDRGSYPDAVCIHLEVKPEYRRQGVATAIYKFARERARKMGKRLLPSPHLTDDSYAVWQKIDPEMIRGYYKNEEGVANTHIWRGP